MLTVKSFQILAPWLFTLGVFSSPLQSSYAESLSELAVDYAHHYHGERESHGYNRSPNIDAWNRLAGVPVGSSWCEAFVYSMFEYAARELGVQNPLKRTAAVWQQLHYANSYGSHRFTVIPIRGVYGAVGNYKPQKGDIANWKRRGGSSRDIGRSFLGHTGLVVFGDDSRLLTIEGNTGGSFADGDGVYRKWRPTRNVLAIIRVNL